MTERTRRHCSLDDEVGTVPPNIDSPCLKITSALKLFGVAQMSNACELSSDDRTECCLLVNTQSVHETEQIIMRRSETKRDGYAYARVVPLVTYAEGRSRPAPALRLHISFKSEIFEIASCCCLHHLWVLI